MPGLKALLGGLKGTNMTKRNRGQRSEVRNLVLSAAVLFLSLSASGCGYNTLQTKQQNVKAKWANVESQIQRRSDLIPNLFEAAKAGGVKEQAVSDEHAAAPSRLFNTT